MGLMRSLRTQLLRTNNVTVNMVAPWLTTKYSSRNPFFRIGLITVTETPMLKDEFLRVWGDLPANEPIGVARALLLPAIRPDVNGKSMFVSGHRIIDFEEGLAKTQPIWMGEELSKHVDEGQRRIVP